MLNKLENFERTTEGLNMISRINARCSLVNQYGVTAPTQVLNNKVPSLRTPFKSLTI